MSFVLHGIGVSEGIAIGRAQLVSHATLEVAHYAVPAEQVSAEIERLTQAIRAVQKELESLHGAMTSGDAPAEFGAFLDVHWMILTDPTLSEIPKRMIAEQHCNAEWALTQQMGVLVEQFDAIEDPYLRERRRADDPGCPRSVARRCDPVQKPSFCRVPDRPRRCDITHGDRCPQSQ